MYFFVLNKMIFPFIIKDYNIQEINLFIFIYFLCVYFTTFLFKSQETLFPYAEENVESFLTKRYDDEETQEDIKALQELVHYLPFPYIFIIN